MNELGRPELALCHELICKARKREAFDIKVRDIFEMNRKI